MYTYAAPILSFTNLLVLINGDALQLQEDINQVALRLAHYIEFSLMWTLDYH